MATVYLPEYSLVDALVGKHTAVLNAGVMSVLIEGCLELATLSDGKANPVYDLPHEYTAQNMPESAIKHAAHIASNIIKTFDIRSYGDYLSIRHMVNKYYEYAYSFRPDYDEVARHHDRWYYREWATYHVKTGKGNFGVLANIDNSKGQQSLALGIDGKEFKTMPSSVALFGNTYKKHRDATKLTKALSQNENWKDLKKAYSSLDLYKHRDRMTLVKNTAIEIAEASKRIVIMEPYGADQRAYYQRNGINDVIDMLELMAVQTRHLPEEKRIYVERISSSLMKPFCTSNNHTTEMVAMLTNMFGGAPKATKKKKTVNK